MISKGEIWAVVEHADGAVKEVTYEVLNAARTLADGGGGRVTAVCLGGEEDIALEPLFRYGANRVLFLRHDQLANYTNAGYRAALLSSFEGNCPELILLAATIHGKELAPGLAAELGGGLATDCVAVEMDKDRGLTVKRPVFAGKAVSTICFGDSVPKIITLRPNVFRGAGEDASRTGEVEVREVSAISLRVKVKEVIREVGGNLDISEARIVVSGGMGMQKPENFKLIEDLAEVLGAAVGASRPVVDGGWRPYSNQVGQTGRTVTPDLYVACGISGAVQHLAGMSSSKNIVAINKDPNAPIFSVADYGILGDVLEVLPILTQELKKAKAR
ncbi:MAG: electron transfer flavoprotein subunit alpha/FixB family protein [Nitrospinales bacterium]